MVASEGRSVIRNLRFLNSIIAGSGFFRLIGGATNVSAVVMIVAIDQSIKY